MEESYLLPKYELKSFPSRLEQPDLGMSTYIPITMFMVSCQLYLKT